MRVDDLVAKARQELEASPHISRNVLLGGELVEVRLPRLRGDQWRDLAAKHPPRGGSFADQNLGFNTDGLVKNLPGVTIARGDDIDDLIRIDDEGNRRYTWPDVFTALDAFGIETLVQAAWEAHVYDAQQKVIAAGKASRGGRRPKPASRANSASQSES